MTSFSLTTALRETLSLFDESGVPLTTTEVAEDLDVGRRSAYDRLDRLVEYDRLETKKVGANGRVWWRPEGAEADGIQDWGIAAESIIHDVLDTADISMFLIDENFEVVWINRTTERYFGITREDVIGREKREVITEQIAPRVSDEESFRETILAAYVDQTQVEEFLCHVTPAEEDEARWLEHRSMPIESGTYAGGQVELYYDVTERKERESKLRSFRQAVEASGHSIYFTEPDGTIEYVNPAFEEITGYTDEEAIGRNPRILKSGEHDEAYYEDMWSTILAGEVWRNELINTTKRGERYVVDQTIAPLTDESGAVEQFVAVNADITDRAEAEWELKRQREQLAAINHLHDVIHDVTDIVIKQSTREEIEQTVCEALVGKDPYESAWIGTVDAPSGTLDVRSQAGAGGTPGGPLLPVELEEDEYDDTTGSAIRTQTLQVTNSVAHEVGHQHWCDNVETPAACSLAAVPLVHDETVYGVLNVYTTRPSAFKEHEQEMLGQFGDIVSQSIAATERKEALLSDEVVELNYRIPSVFESLGIDVTAEGTITLEDIVATSDGAYLVYGSMTPDARETVDALNDQHPDWDSVTMIAEEDDSIRFQARIAELPIGSNLAAKGGSIEELVLAGSNLDFQIHLPPSVGANSITEMIEETYPGARLIAKRQFPRPLNPVTEIWQSLHEDLTDRQRAVLEAAYHRGYFEWPRETSGEGIADSLGIAAPTFSQHLRKAERTVIESVFSFSALA